MSRSQSKYMQETMDEHYLQIIDDSNNIQQSSICKNLLEPRNDNAYLQIIENYEDNLQLTRDHQDHRNRSSMKGKDHITHNTDDSAYGKLYNDCKEQNDYQIIHVSARFEFAN